ncbi:50S ribosomal protein L4 [Candidatus Woesearchaeota archaeon]|nr:50S ribosomal protein L4 [Candidatus Woesearchaeota archaeon]
MKLSIYGIDGTEKGKKQLPVQFTEPVRYDIVERAVLAIHSHGRQPYGADPMAGMKVSAKVSRRRRDYKGAYGMGISRVPRKVLSRKGTRMNWVGAEAPGTVGGRRAHPPKSSKDWTQKINKKERRKAIRSAMSAVVQTETVKARGHIVPKHYPFILENAFESLAKTKDVATAFGKLGLEQEAERASVTTIRPGKGKLRGRKYRGKIGPLVVVSKPCSFGRAVNNIPGFDAVVVKDLNANVLAPGAALGRITLFTEAAIEVLEKEKLFM